jgi:hypothetical protein
MISIPEFTKFEQPLSLMKVPEDSQVSRLQSWKLPKQEMAETLFAVLSQTLHGDISSGPVVITKKNDGWLVCVVWRTQDSILRRQLSEQLDPFFEPMVEQTKRAMKDGCTSVSITLPVQTTEDL